MLSLMPVTPQLLRRALYLLLVIAALVVLWRLSVAYTLSETRHTQQRLQSVQLTELNRQLTQFSYIPKLLSEDVEIRAALSSPADNTLHAANQRLQRTQSDSGLDFAFLLNRDGLTIASSNWADSVSFVGVSYSFRPYFKQAVQGLSATFFAVGATTGIPGYFIAEPVFDMNRVLGVVVAKIALDVLVDAWSQLPYESLVSDEFGGVILSTRDDLLHTPTLSLSVEQIKQLETERRYELQPRVLQLHGKDEQKRVINREAGQDVFLLFSQSLAAEPWQLLSLVSERDVHRQAWLLSATIASIALIAYLLLRLYQQQRRLVRSEQRNSQELEEQVVRRTQQLEHAQQRLISESNFAMLGRMSAAINHEINQPLASLRLNLASLRTMIERPGADQVEIGQIVIDSDRTTKRIGRVISSLRSLTRREDSRFQVIDIEKVAQDVYNTVKRERPAASEYLALHMAEGSYRVMGDEVLIQQALLNLLYNAFDAVISTRNPDISLSVQASTHGVPEDRMDAAKCSAKVIVLAVTDNGEGVSESAVESLFQPFSTTRRQHDGLGLGLTIARQIAVDHGGELRYQSRRQGSRFSLSLPIHYVEQRG